MTTKYSQMRSACLSFLFVFSILEGIPVFRAIGQQAPPATSGKTPLSKLTPEQRKEREEAKLKKESEERQQRIDIFGVLPADDDSPLASEYRKATEEFRKTIAVLGDTHLRMQIRFDEQVSSERRKEWFDKINTASETLVAWRNHAAELYASNSQRYEAVGLLLREMLIADGIADRHENWGAAARALIVGDRLVTDEVLMNAGYIGFSTCDWELATMAWKPLAEQGKLTEVESRMLQEMPAIAASWEKEQERLREDEAKNNPRVEFRTTKGTIEIELFEDDAPEAVANFIYLVENGYYDRKPIFLVRKHFLLQTGCEKGDGKGNPGYTIGFEADSPNRRNHFRGSLAIPLSINTETRSIDPNSGGGQFYISYLPLQLFDGRHTVFGRVVKGIDILGFFDEINLTDEEQRKDTSLRPDSVVSASVLRKRDHEYIPKPALGRLPR